MPQVGEDAQAMPAVVDDEGDAIHAVVGRGDRLHRHAVEPQAAARLEMPHVAHGAQLAAGLGGAERLGGRVDRQAELPLVDARRLAVVAVLVRDEHGIDVAAVAGEPLLDLAAAQPGVDEYAQEV